jgi:N-acyl-D-amino-acid deacylase
VRSEKNKWMEGSNCRALAQGLDKDPVDFVCDWLAEEELAVTMISHYGSPDVLARGLAHPSATIGTDGIYCGSPHPRLYGSYPRFLQEFVVHRRMMSWQEAIRKCTSQPAFVLGLADRGLIKEGMAADLVVMDPSKVADNSTYEDPIRYPSGIDLVAVNGSVVVEANGPTGTLPGRVLRKSCAL